MKRQASCAVTFLLVLWVHLAVLHEVLTPGGWSDTDRTVTGHPGLKQPGTPEPQQGTWFFVTLSLRTYRVREY